MALRNLLRHDTVTIMLACGIVVYISMMSGPMEQLPITRVEHIDFNPGPIRSDLIALNKVDQENERRKKGLSLHLTHFTRPETFRLDFEPSSWQRYPPMHVGKHRESRQLDRTGSHVCGTPFPRASRHCRRRQEIRVCWQLESRQQSRCQ